MRLILLALLLLAVPVLGQVAPAEPVVAFDVLHRIDPTEDLVILPCDDGAVDVDARGFTFRESTGATGGNEGYMATGCATVRHSMTLPAGIEHFHVFFDADRQITSFSGGGAATQFIQEVQVVSTAGDGLASRRMFDANGTEEPLTPFNFVFLPPAGGPQIVHVDWVFQDIGFGAQEDVPNPLSGVDYRSRVEDIVLETSGVPAIAQAERAERWTGTALLNEWTVQASVTDVATSNLRVRLGDEFTFAYLEAPDGTRFDLIGTRTEAGPDGYDKSRVLGENMDGVYQATVPAQVLQQLGPGDYILVFQSKEPAQQDPVLVGVALLMAMTPLPFAALAIVQVTRFRQQAFGGFARAATHLRTAVALVLAYYGVVMLASLAAGRLHFLAILPLNSEGLLLYVQIIAAVVAFIVLWLVARELDRITRPMEEHAD